MSLETVVNSELGRQFEKIVRSSRKNPSDVLARLMAEHIESVSDGKLFDKAARESRKDLSENDAVELVRRARREGHR